MACGIARELGLRIIRTDHREHELRYDKLSLPFVNHSQQYTTVEQDEPYGDAHCRD